MKEERRPVQQPREQNRDRVTETLKTHTATSSTTTPPVPHTKKEDRLNELRSVLRGVVKTDETKNTIPKGDGKDAKNATFEKSHAELKNLIAQTLKNPPQHAESAVRSETLAAPSSVRVSKQRHIRRTRVVPRFTTPEITPVSALPRTATKHDEQPSTDGTVLHRKNSSG
jgi:hypothetical protein